MRGTPAFSFFIVARPASTVSELMNKPTMARILLTGLKKDAALAPETASFFVRGRRPDGFTAILYKDKYIVGQTINSSYDSVSFLRGSRRGKRRGRYLIVQHSWLSRAI